MELPKNADTDQPWQWEEARWRSLVDKIRAGRSLKPAEWKDGARVAVALSFDSDHETLTLRSGDSSPGKLSQGQYGNRVGDTAHPRHACPPRAFPPPSSCPRWWRCSIRTSSARSSRRGTRSGSTGGSTSSTAGSLRPTSADLQMRAADTLERIAGVRPVGIRTPSWDFSQHTLGNQPRDGTPLRLLPVWADDEPYELLDDGEPTGIVELPVEWIRDDAVYFYMDRFSSLRPYTPPSACAGDLQARVSTERTVSGDCSS